MVDDDIAWSIRSALVSVSDLDRSTHFYQDLMNIREVLREGQIALLRGVPGSPMLFLRQAYPNAFRTGQQALGVRSLTWDVGSVAEFERVEERLRALDAFRERQSIRDDRSFELILGHDPDRLPLTFMLTEPGQEVSQDDFHRGLIRLYSVDV